MSKYTTQVRYICEDASGLGESVGYDNVNEVIKKAVPIVFDFDFPIFDESYRNVLCGKILKNFYMKEIGAETVGLWKMFLDNRLNMIMPYYNQLYESQLIKFNPLYEVDLTRDYTKTGDETKENIENSTTKDTNTLRGNDSESGTISDTGIVENDKVYNDISNKDIKHTKDFNSTDNEKIDSETKGQNQSSSKIESTSESDDTKWRLHSDTPQGGISNMGIEENNFLTTATKDTDKLKVDGNTDTALSGTDSSKVIADNTKKNTSKEIYTSEDDLINSGTETANIKNDNLKRTDMNYNKNQTSTTDIMRNNTLNGTVNNLESYFERVRGKSSGTSYSKLLNEFRSTFLNIDQMVIDELRDLFMLIY